MKVMGLKLKSVVCQLAVAGATNARFKRQETVPTSNIYDNLSASSASPSSVPASNTESASDVSATSTSTGSGPASSISASDSSTTSTANDAPAPTIISSNSTSVNSSQTTSATTTTSLEETNPSEATPIAADADLADQVKKCHRPNSNTTNPFCTPMDGQNIKATKHYPAIWDPAAFPGTNNSLEIQVSAQNNDSTGANLNSLSFKSSGFAIISLNNWYSIKKTEIVTQKITLSLINKLDNGTRIWHKGPSLILINQPAPKPSSTKFGIKVGLAFAPLFIGFGILLLCYWCKKTRIWAVAKLRGRRCDNQALFVEVVILLTVMMFIIFW